MAEQKSYTQAVGWGRLSDGRFFIQVDMQVNAPDGRVVRVPVTAFILTKEEELQLKAGLTGLHLASAGNGHKLA